MYLISIKQLAERYLEMCLTYPQLRISRDLFDDEVQAMVSQVAEMHKKEYNVVLGDMIAMFDDLPNNPFAHIGEH